MSTSTTINTTINTSTHNSPAATAATTGAPAVSVEQSVRAVDQAGAVTGRPRTWLRVEAAFTATAAVGLCLAIGQPWWLLLALFLGRPPIGARP